jgi:HTH-type transcriptional regulator, transcriptional repressor of NAD biosynthesis genes
MRRFTASQQLTDLVVVLASTGLVLAAAAGVIPATLLESVGFATGAVSVWLVVRQSIWTWPIGIANNIVFIVLFLEARLYADMALQFVYVAMSIGGWWYWLNGGRKGGRRIGRVGIAEAGAVAIVTGMATYSLTIYLRSVDDSAPFLDALTTSLSLAAMYLMARKLLENWFVWIAADLVYIPLYAWKELPLTAVLYGVFLAMCVRGVVLWRKPFRHAVVAGKFYPFHAGHRYLIGEAVREAHKVSVLVCDRADYTVAGELRAKWITAAFPGIETVVVDQDELGLSDDDSPGWAAATIDALGVSPDAVSSSEDYGDGYAAAMGSVHRLVDRERRVVPISGTLVRSAPLAHLDLLDPPVRAHYVKRVCLLGAESTGKTTLALRLAKRYGTVCVTEYGREYSVRRHKKLGDRWTTAEFRHIADVQAQREDLLAQRANGVLFCDTDVFTTACFHDVYMGFKDGMLEEQARERGYDLYLLCGLDVPFVQDGWRDDGPHREAMDAAYRAFLEETGAIWIELRGSYEERMEQAVAAVDGLIASGLGRVSAAG